MPSLKRTPRRSNSADATRFRMFGTEGFGTVCFRAAFWGFLLVSLYGTALAGPARTKEKPTGLKRPSLNRPVPTDQRLPAAETTSIVSAEAAAPESLGAAYTNTPPASASFEALLSDGSAFAPDTHGAVGPNHLMVALNTEVRIQTRSGSEVSRMALDDWWAADLTGIFNVFDPRVVYDTYRNRWIFSANNDPLGPNAAVLLAVSATSDPTGTWYRRKISLPASNLFADLPMLGFNTNWIVLAADTYDTNTFNFVSAEVYVFNKADLYANGSLPPTRFSTDEIMSLVPVVTYDPTNSINYLVSVWSVNDELDPPKGYLVTYKISGPVGAPVFSRVGFPFGLPWADTAAIPNSGPQAGTANKVFLSDSRIRSATFRRGTIQAAHTVFLPADNPTRAAVQWWEFSETATFHRALIDSGSTTTMYAYPSIAANRSSDIVVGFSRFSTTEFPSAGYAFRKDVVDPEDTLRPQVLLKAGVASYFRTNSAGQNLWGDWSATMVDPLNDTDFWTIQQYAEAPSGATPRWGTWWGRISPPNDLVLTAVDSPDPVVAGSNLTYTITVTNLASGNGGPHASGVRISNSLPVGLTFVSASASQGTCTHASGLVICDLGTLTNLTRATAAIVVRPTVVGTVNNTIAVHANGPDADFNDNVVAVGTTVLPSADLEVLLAESQDPVNAGAILTYTVTVTNRGPAGATLVRVTNNLPASCTFVGVTQPVGGACTNSGLVVRCDFSTIAANTAASFTITARPATGGIFISNRVNVAASSVDTVAANNVASILTYVNARPTISAILNRTINEDTTTGAIAFTIGDVETLEDNLELVASSSNPTLIPNVILGGSGASRTFTITPAPNESGSSIITIAVTDELGATTNRMFTVNVTSVNDVPTITAIGNPPAIDEDTSTADLPFTIGDVETLPENLTLTAASSNPTLVPVANIDFGGAGASHTVRITPASNQNGTATITVTVGDGVASGNATFVVTVNQVNDPPAISTIGNRTVNEDTSTGAITFNIIDVESSAALSLSATSSNPALAPTNRFTFGGTGTNRTVTILPATNQFGTADITITVSDGSLTDSATFMLTVNPVNDVPTLADPGNITTNEDAGQIIVLLSGISSGAANEDQLLTLVVSNSNPAVVQVVSANYVSDQPTGTLVLQTVENAVGSSTISVTIRDGGTSNNVVTQSFILTTTAINDPPVISAIPDQMTDEDVAAVGIPFIISDVETAASSLTLSGGSSDPAIVPIANITFGGTANNRTVNVRPATNQFGEVTITVTVSDAVNTVSTTFRLSINSINDAPRFVTPVPNRTIPEDTSATIPFVVGDVETAAGALDVTVTASSNPALVPLGSISFGGTGSNRTVFIMPVTNEVGSSTITLRLSDGMTAVSDSFDFAVTNINDAPRILTQIPNQTISEDTATAVLPFTVDDEETAAGSLTVTGASSNPTLVPVGNIAFTGAGSSSRTVQVTSAANQFGSATITVNVSDGVVTGSDSFIVTVTSVNDLPIISSVPNVVTNEDFPTAALAFTVRDPETVASSLLLVASSSNPEVVDDSGILIAGTSTNRTVVVRPLTNQVGTTTILISVTDASNAVTTTEFEVTFNEVNDRPSIINIGNLTVNEDTNSVLVAFTIDDPETLPENLRVTASSSTQTLVPNSNLTLAGTGANRALTMVPLANQSGTTTISISVDDGTLTNTDTFVLTVTAVNDRPTISAIPNRTINEDTSTGPLAFTVGDVETAAISLTPSATSSDPAVVPISGITFGGSGANRTVTVKPATNQFGSSLITVNISDGTLMGSTSFLVTVTPVNDAPTLNAIANLTIAEDAAEQTVNFSGVAAGPPNESQTLIVTASSSNPSVIANPIVNYTSPQAIGSLRFSPLANASGVATITVTVDDGQSASRFTSRNFTVTVTAANDTPTISDIPNLTTAEDTPVSFAFTIGDVETDPSALTLAGTSSNPALLANTNITFHGSGALRTLVLTPTANQFGTSTVTITVSDGVATANDTFVLTVNAVNDPPTLDPIRDVFVVPGANTTVILTGITSGAANETQALTVSNTFVSNPGLFQSGPSINYTNPSTTAALVFRPANNQSGTSVVTVTVRETTNAASLTSQSFIVYLRPTANTAPTISTITNRTTLEDTSISIPFIVGDAQTPANLLTVRAMSTNLALFPSNSFSFSGSGSNRTLTITPPPNLFGSATITVSVTDTNFGGASTNFLITVTPVNDLPVISSIPSQTIQKNTSTGPLPFAVADAETAAGNLTLSATSSNPTLVPVANIDFGGSGTNRAVIVTPATNQIGTAIIVVTVRDANSGTATSTFTVDVLNTAPAVLTIVRSGNSVTVSWPIGAGSFVLQARNSLELAWGDVSAAPVQAGGQNIVTQTLGGAERFYRLRSP
jgi:uncharacterized repeat protein (TIGR01451 family)